MKGFFKENLGLKLLSLILAILLEYYFFSPDNSVTANVAAKVYLRNLPRTMMVVSPSNADRGVFVQVKVRGPNSLVGDIERANPEIVVDLPNPTPPNFVALLESDQLLLPKGVDVLEIDPSSVDFKMERVVKKELVVVVKQTGTPPKGYRLNKIKVFPETVLAQGPHSELEGLGTVETAEVDVSSLKEPKTVELPLVYHGKLTALKVNVVRVLVEVVPIEEELAFEQMSIEAIAPLGFAASVQPTKARIVLAGPAESLLSVKERDIRLLAKGVGFSDGTSEVAVTAEIPEGLRVARIEPEKVSLTLVTKKKEVQ